VSVRPYRGSFEPVGVAHPVTSHIKPLAAKARAVRTRQHRIKHDTRMLGWPQRPAGSVAVIVNLGTTPVQLSGRMSVRMEDGTVIELTPGTVFHIPPGHDAWTEGDEACVELDFGGLTGYAVPKK
jgi:uncharacterized cupin superfamily protein